MTYRTQNPVSQEVRVQFSLCPPNAYENK